MRQAHSQDPSTLATLRPAESREVHYKSYRTSPRLSGSHFMTLRRVSRVPEAGREYVPGDPPHLIDWKAYARTDQLIVREVRDEAAARVLIGLDLSETMQWPTPAEPLRELPATKAEIALRIAYNVAHLHLRMGDLVEIWVIADGKAKEPDLRFAPRSPADLVSSFARIESAKFARDAALYDFEARDRASFSQRTFDCAFWVGDALSAADLGAFLGLGKRSMLLHVLSSLELDIGWVEGTTSYFDEGSGRREYQGQVLRHRDNYAKHLAAWRQGLAVKQRRRGGDYVTLSDKTTVSAFQQSLSGFFTSQLTTSGKGLGQRT